MAELETDRLLIREVLASDADDFVRYRQQEDYWRHVAIEPPTADTIAAMVSGWIQNQAQNPRIVYFLAVTDKRSHQLVGDAGLLLRSVRSRQGEIGWGVISTHTGQGLATEIGRALLRLAFDTLILHQVFAQCRVEHQASRRIMAKPSECVRKGCSGRMSLRAANGGPQAQSSILSSEWNTAAKAE